MINRPNTYFIQITRPTYGFNLGQTHCIVILEYYPTPYGTNEGVLRDTEVGYNHIDVNHLHPNSYNWEYVID